MVSLVRFIFAQKGSRLELARECSYTRRFHWVYNIRGVIEIIFHVRVKKICEQTEEKKENNEIKIFSCSTLTDLFNDFSPTTSLNRRTTSSWRQSAAQLTVAAELKSENDGTGEESSSHGPHLTALIILNIHNERSLDMLSSSCAI